MLKLHSFQSVRQLWTMQVEQIFSAPPVRSYPPPVRFLRSRQVAFYTLSLLTMTAAHGIRYYNEPHLTEGSLARSTIIAPTTALIVDNKATESLKKQVREQTIQVLQVDASANAQMNQALQQILYQVSQDRQQAGILPVVPTATLTLAEQTTLRRLTDVQWQELQAALSAATTQSADKAGTKPPRISPTLGLAISELPDPADPIWPQIQSARQRYALIKTQQSPVLLDLSAKQWQTLQDDLKTALHRLQSIGIAPGLPVPVRRQGIQAQLGANVPDTVNSIAVGWLEQVLMPNLQVDPIATHQQTEAALAAIQPVTSQVSEGQIIVRSGEPITATSFAILDYYGLTQRRINGWGLLGVAGVMGVTLGVFRFLQGRIRPQIRNRDRLLLLLLTLTVAPLATTLGIHWAALPAVALLVSSFYGRSLALLIIVGETLFIPLTGPVSLTQLIPLLLGSLVAATMAERLRSREELAFLGGVAALTQVGIQGVLTLITGSGLDLASLMLTGGVGLGWSIIALGASPYLERLFDLITPIRLLELANPNRPLLKRLASEAPGTFQHTLFVSSLAERAAQRLNANAELVRTGTLYHDIGKMLAAEYFIENQMGRPNPHVELDNPYESAKIIKAHVTDGLRLARQYALPSAVTAFIPEHQGTICIAYFYHQAQKRALSLAVADTGSRPIRLDSSASKPSGSEPSRVDEADFRYAGPIPQSRETGIVMLADACEAALRSLGSQDCLTAEVSQEAQAMVKRICQTRWHDQQLKNSGLTLPELDTIVDTFIEVWRQSHHERIRYPVPSQPDITVGHTSDPAFNKGV